MNESTIELDLSTWTRLPEVRKWAERWNVPLEEAIKRLVNTGLSHEF